MSDRSVSSRAAIRGGLLFCLFVTACAGLLTVGLPAMRTALRSFVPEPVVRYVWTVVGAGSIWGVYSVAVRLWSEHDWRAGLVVVPFAALDALAYASIGHAVSGDPLYPYRTFTALVLLCLVVTAGAWLVGALPGRLQRPGE